MTNSYTIPPAILLCGGMGTRLRDVTEILPKPMVPIGPQPIIWHIMKTYAAYGVKRFILCLGYKRETFIDYFMSYRARSADVTLRLGDKSKIIYHGDRGNEDWEITLVDTGEQTMTGGRVGRAAKFLRPDDKECFLTYGDGLSNVDIKKLLAHHRKAKREITLTAVHPAGRFGEMKIDGDRVKGFHEKPQTEAGLINGGYMVLNREFIEKRLTGDTSLILENGPLRTAVRDGQMTAYVHEGFWQCMDTQREHQLLTQLWESGDAPWTEAW